MILPYLCYANNGVSTTPYYLLSIKDRDGRILYEAEPPRRERVIPAEQAHIMSSMLSAVIQEGTGKRLINNYGLNIPLAGKTGTTQNQADGWFIGYNPRIVVGVRVGANNSRVHFNSTALAKEPTWLFLSSACSCRNACKVTLTPIGPVCPSRFHPWMYKRIWKYLLSRKT